MPEPSPSNSHGAMGPSTGLGMWCPPSVRGCSPLRKGCGSPRTICLSRTCVSQCRSPRSLNLWCAAPRRALQLSKMELRLPPLVLLLVHLALCVPRCATSLLLSFLFYSSLAFLGDGESFQSAAPNDSCLSCVAARASQLFYEIVFVESVLYRVLSRFGQGYCVAPAQPFGASVSFSKGSATPHSRHTTIIDRLGSGARECGWWPWQPPPRSPRSSGNCASWRLDSSSFRPHMQRCRTYSFGRWWRKGAHRQGTTTHTRLNFRKGERHMLKDCGGKSAPFAEFSFKIESYVTALDPTDWGGELGKRAGRAGQSDWRRLDN